MSEPEHQQRQLQGLALLLQLQRKARHCADATSLAFTIVNETRSFIAYRQAVLWTAQPNSSIFAISGVAVLEPHAPYTVWLKQLCEFLTQQSDNNAPIQITARDTTPELAEGWQEWSAPYALWLPLRNSRQVNIAGLILFRDIAWNPAEITLLTELTDSYTYAWIALQASNIDWRNYIRNFKLRWLWLLLVIFLLPIRQSVLAPAEIVAIDPTLVRAPLDGVVAEFHVQPNQTINSGDLLITLENTDIANRLDITRKALAVAETDLRSNEIQALFDGKNKADLNVLKGKVQQHTAEVAYMADQLERSQIKAPQSGVVIFTDVQDWLGKPVSVGEGILQIANSQQVELKIHLPVADLITFDDNAETVMFLNSDPQNPLQANLYYISYQAEINSDNLLTYRLKAHLQLNNQPPRIGLKGTAKIYGQRVTLFYYLFRRPLAGLRQWLGL
jgi:hypothetical protein